MSDRQPRFLWAVALVVVGFGIGQAVGRECSAPITPLTITWDLPTGLVAGQPIHCTFDVATQRVGCTPTGAAPNCAAIEASYQRAMERLFGTLPRGAEQYRGPTAPPTPERYRPRGGMTWGRP